VALAERLWRVVDAPAGDRGGPARPIRSPFREGIPFAEARDGDAGALPARTGGSVLLTADAADAADCSRRLPQKEPHDRSP
jgi:hypothetical protein